jgi:hypothetical protein
VLCLYGAACVVGSTVIAVGALITLLLPVPADGVGILARAWCFVPAVWGLWAVLAPADWVPNRLPVWGAILGVAAGTIAGPVLDLPTRIGGLSGMSWLAIPVGPILYYALWLLVRNVYRSMAPEQSGPEAIAGKSAA